MNHPTDNPRDDNQRDPHDDARKSPEQLEREVDLARNRLGKTADELSDRLSPGELVDQAFSMAREHGGDFGRNLSAQVKNNPLPMILTSVGLSWLMLSSNHRGASQFSNAPRTQTNLNGHGLTGTAGNTVATSREKMSSLGDRMHDATGHAKESMQSARQSLIQFYREQPLIAGGLGIAIGAAIGALIPHTEMEDEVLGELSGRPIDAARPQATNAYRETQDTTPAE